MPQYLLHYQGLIENTGLGMTFLALAWFVLYVWPAFKTGWNSDPLAGNEFRQ
jgi:hypothetical protein